MRESGSGSGGSKWGRRADPMFIGDRLRTTQLVRIMNEPNPVNSTSVHVTWQLRRIPAHYIDGYRVSYRVLPDYDQSFRVTKDDSSFMEDTVLGGSVMTHEIVGLEKYTVYELFVRPFFRDVVGQQSNVVRVRTAEDGNFLYLYSVQPVLCISDTQGSPTSLKVLEFKACKFKALESP